MFCFELIFPEKFSRGALVEKFGFLNGGKENTRSGFEECAPDAIRNARTSIIYAYANRQILTGGKNRWQSKRKSE